MDNASQILSFIKLMEKMKEIERFRGQVFWRDYPAPQRFDSPADHSWRMALLLMAIEKKLSQPLDMLKALKMTLIHDIPEVLVGNDSPLGSDGTGKDSHTYNPEVAEQKFNKEKIATEKICSQLPEGTGDELMQLWLEYEKQETFEAKVIKALNAIEGKLQVTEWRQGSMFKGHLDFSLAYGVEYLEVDPILKEIGGLINTEMQESYTEFVKA